MSRRTKTRRRALTAAAAASAAVIGWTTHGGPQIHAQPHGYTTTAASSAQISQLLAKLTVIDKLPAVPGYQRGCGVDKSTHAKQACVFGKAWNDPLDHTGCDTRSRILRVQLVDVTIKPDTHGCKPLSGLLHDPYSGTDITYSADDPAKIQIDHVVPEAAAWNLGASTWQPQQRQIFANDTTNLLAVSGHLNIEKSDSTISQWVPPNEAFVCTYIQTFLTVLDKYRLPVTRADRDTARRDCVTGKP